MVLDKLRTFVRENKLNLRECLNSREPLHEKSHFCDPKKKTTCFKGRELVDATTNRDKLGARTNSKFEGTYFFDIDGKL